MTNKQDLRKMLRQRMSIGSSAEASVIINRLRHHSVILRARTLLLYNSLPDEVPTQELIDEFVSEGKTVLLPRVISATEMQLCRYTGPDDLKQGAYGIMEPVSEVFTNYQQIEAAIIPGMAFDRQGHRLGRGKGYYDRFLPLLTNTYKIGVCYPSRLLDEIPVDDHDIMMDEVIS